MRTKLLIVLAACSLLSCKNKQDKPLDWKQSIDKAISHFESSKSLTKEGELKTGKQTVLYSIFSDKNSTIIKYDMNSSLGDAFPMVEEIYIKNNKIIFSKFSGLSPYINKGKLNDSSRCCAIFENKTYFKSPKKAVIYKKKIDLRNVEEYESAKEDLNKMTFEEEQLEKAYPTYDRLLRTIEMVAQ